MSKKVKIILGIICSLALLAIVGLLILSSYISPDIPSPKSDVPITYKIGWGNNGEEFIIESIKAEVLYPHLTLTNSKALVEYTVKGSFSYKGSWKPYVKSVHVSERWIAEPQNFEDNFGEIEIVPLVGVKSDDNYDGEQISFSVTVQDYLYTGGWGTNTYTVRSQDKVDTIILHQRK